MIVSLLSHVLCFVAGAALFSTVPWLRRAADNALVGIVGRTKSKTNELVRAARATLYPRRPVKLFSFIGLPFGVPWKLVGCVLAAVAILGLLYFFGQSRYAQGVSEERGRWEVAMRAAEQRAHNAEMALARDIAERREQAQNRTHERNAQVDATRNEIASAADTEARLAALRGLRERLRNAASERHAGLRADYLSGLDA